MKAFAVTAALAVLVALPATVLALGFETFGNAPAVKQPEWAEGILDVVNLKNRIYSQWVNGNEAFFYRGDSKAVNEAIRTYAAVKGERELILLPGSGKTQTFDRKPIDFEWKLQVPSGIYRALAKKKHAVLTVYVSGARPRPVEGKTVEKWLADLNSADFKTREAAKLELEKLGNDAKPFLREALKGKVVLESRLRIEALLEKLRDLDVSDLEIPKGLPVLSVEELVGEGLKNLRNTDSHICAGAIQDLTALARYSDLVVPALTPMLDKDKSEYTRRVAAGCLAYIGAKAKSALPLLKQGLDDPDANIRNSFQQALEQFEKAQELPGDEQRIQLELAILKEIDEVRKTAGASK